MSAGRVLRLGDLKVGDTVRTPLQLEALVVGVAGSHTELWYCDSGEEVALLPHVLELVRHSPELPVSDSFVRGAQREGRR